MGNVLVTGASGFIGSKLLEYFYKKGYNTIGWDKNNVIQKTNIICFDLCNKSDIIRQLNEFCPDIIIHCAGNADVTKSVQNPETDYQGNVTITHNLLFGMHYLKMYNTCCVFLSSAGVYGNPTELPISEETELNPLSPYAVHKVMCEELCRYFVNNYGMNIKIARIFSAYGPGLRKQIFWDMYNKAKDFGSLNMFGSGNESRDYIYIDDLIHALYLLATKKSEDIIFNIANGEETTIRYITECFANTIGISKDRILFSGIIREGDPINWKANINKIQNLGYKKTITIHQGIQKYITWAENQQIT